MSVGGLPSKIVQVLEDPDEVETLEAVRDFRRMLDSAERVNAKIVIYRDAISVLELSNELCNALKELEDIGVEVVLVEESLVNRTIRPPCGVKYRIEPISKALSFNDGDLLIIHGSTCPYSIRR